MKYELNDVETYSIQIERQIKRAIYKSDLKSGDELPTKIHLDEKNEIGIETLLEVYRDLIKQGLLYEEFGSYYVTLDKKVITGSMYQQTALYVTTCLQYLVEMGYSQEQIKTIISNKINTLKFPK